MEMRITLCAPAPAFESDPGANTCCRLTAHAMFAGLGYRASLRSDACAVKCGGRLRCAADTLMGRARR